MRSDDVRMALNEARAEAQYGGGDDAEDIREQIRQAVHEARAMAHARAMEGGAFKLNGPKFSEYKPRTTIKRNGQVHERQVNRIKTRKECPKGRPQKGRECVTVDGNKILDEMKNNSADFLNNNSRYRSYIAYVGIVSDDNNSENIKTYAVRNVGVGKGNKQISRKRLFHGKPLSAAKKVLSTLGSKKLDPAIERDNRGYKTLSRGEAQSHTSISEDLMPVADHVKSGGHVKIVLFEVTQGVRKNGNNQDLLSKYFSYTYFGKREHVEGKTIEIGGKQVTYNYKNDVVRAKKNDSLNQTLRARDEKNARRDGRQVGMSIADYNSMSGKNQKLKKERKPVKGRIRYMNN